MSVQFRGSVVCYSQHRLVHLCPKKYPVAILSQSSALKIKDNNGKPREGENEFRRTQRKRIPAERMATLWWVWDILEREKRAPHSRHVRSFHCPESTPSCSTLRSCRISLDLPLSFTHFWSSWLFFTDFPQHYPLWQYYFTVHRTQTSLFLHCCCVIEVPPHLHPPHFTPLLQHTINWTCCFVAPGTENEICLF